MTKIIKGSSGRTWCTWTEDEDGVYRTDCKGDFQFNEGGPAYNNFHFCCYCGKLLSEKKYGETD